MSKDIWGGFFDLNGDGKTTWDEELLGLSIIHDVCNEDTTSVEMNTRKHKPEKAKSTPRIKKVPEIVNESNYRSLRNEYVVECVCALIAFVIMQLPAVLILWAVYSTYDPTNSASDFIITIFTIAGLGYSCIIIHATAKSIITSVKNLSLAKIRYHNSKQPKKPST